MDTTSDLLEKEEVKLHLTSLAARVWLIDSLSHGNQLSENGMGYVSSPALKAELEGSGLEELRV